MRVGCLKHKLTYLTTKHKLKYNAFPCPLCLEEHYQSSLKSKLNSLSDKIEVKYIEGNFITYTCKKCKKTYTIHKNQIHKKILCKSCYKIEKINRQINSLYEYKIISIDKNYIELKCKEHGLFKRSLTALNNLSGCPKCILEKIQFISHDKIQNKFKDYTFIKYDLFRESVAKCKNNHIFKIYNLQASKNIKCPICENISQEPLIKIKKYLTLESVYIDKNHFIEAKCEKHGIFYRKYKNILESGCPICAREKSSKRGLDKIQQRGKKFIEKSIAIHNNRYNYSKVRYTNNLEPVEIICPIHGIFRQRPMHHLRGAGCPKCSHTISKPELEISEFLENLNVKVSKNSKEFGIEIDILSHEFKFGIEYDGLLWHSFGKNFPASKNEDKYKHLKKTELV